MYVSSQSRGQAKQHGQRNERHYQQAGQQTHERHLAENVQHQRQFLFSKQFMRNQARDYAAKPVTRLRCAATRSRVAQRGEQ
jgi:hypothetical protein